jgi:dihydrofolate synthase/folylpolyglutamate synthase
MGFYPRTHAVLGAMADKDIAGLLAPLLPLVDHWSLCDLPTPRAARAADLVRHIETLRSAAQAAGQVLPAVTIDAHASPSAALQHAMAVADPADRIVTFGSFFTVGGVLQQGLPRRGAAHVG